MVQGPSVELIDAIRNPSSLDAQITSLKQLKDEINGHDQRKEVAVKKGVVQPLVDILTAPAKAAGKRSANGTQPQSSISAWTLEHEARLHATLLLATLAAGGPAFVHPLLAAGTDVALIHATSEDDPSKLITATLRALRNLAASAVLAKETILGSDNLPLESLLKRALLNRIHQKLAAELVAHLAKNDNLRQPLADSLLDILASLLISNTILNEYFDYQGPTSHLPPPPPNFNIPAILSAITSIVEDSKYRTQCFILAPSFREFFSTLWSDGAPLFGHVRNANSNPFEPLLPQVQVPVTKTVSFIASSTAFPALASFQGGEGRSIGSTSEGTYLRPGYDGAIANPVFKWLVFLARSMRGQARLMALELVALVNEAADADSQLAAHRSECLKRQRERECYMAQLVIPLAVQLVHDATNSKSPDPFPPLENDELDAVRERACYVLALLIRPAVALQDAAAECGAIKLVCAVLKQTLDNTSIAKPMWSAHPPSTTAPNDAPESCKMGPHGLPPEIRHVMQCRQSALEAVAAIAGTSQQDNHRKAVVEAGILTCVIDSLKPLTPEFSTVAGGGRPPHNFTSKDGNTVEVILAACHAAQSVSRSVALLRTSIIDSGIVKPTFELISHSDIAVQIAATDVCINLALEFSPMRESLVSLGAVKTLTEHSRQSDMKLRISSMWALKHLVLNTTRDIKIQCLEELGPGWLVGAIQGEQDSSSAAVDLASISTGGVSVPVATAGLSTPNAAGEQVNLLNPPTSMDVDEHIHNGDNSEDEDEDGEVLYDEADGTHYQASQLRSTLHSLRNPDTTTSPASITRYLHTVRENEENPILQAKRDDLAVQEQAIDFIRNMLNGPEDCAFMIEHLCRTIGQNKLFSLLSDKLAPVSGTSVFSDVTTGRSGPKVVYQPTELILTTIHAITHIANGSPTHKQLLIAQKQLLLNWLPHFNHHDRRVRVMCLWAVNALTWVDDDQDRIGAVARVRELRSCGIEQAVKGLVNDVDLDVRERVKTGIRQMELL